VPYGITQCYLPPGRGDIPAFTPAEAGTRFSDPRGMQGCSGIEGSMYKVMKSSVCTGCSDSVISTGRSSVDIGASANLEVVDKFCYR